MSGVAGRALGHYVAIQKESDIGIGPIDREGF